MPDNNKIHALGSGTVAITTLSISELPDVLKLFAKMSCRKLTASVPRETAEATCVPSIVRPN